MAWDADQRYVATAYTYSKWWINTTNTNICQHMQVRAHKYNKAIYLNACTIKKHHVSSVDVCVCVCVCVYAQCGFLSGWKVSGSTFRPKALYVVYIQKDRESKSHTPTHIHTHTHTWMRPFSHTQKATPECRCVPHTNICIQKANLNTELITLHHRKTKIDTCTNTHGCAHTETSGPLAETLGPIRMPGPMHHLREPAVCGLPWCGCPHCAL